MNNPRPRENLPQSEDGGYENLSIMQKERKAPGQSCSRCCSHPVLIGVLLCVVLLVGIAGGYLAAYYLGHHANSGKQQYG